MNNLPIFDRPERTWIDDFRDTCAKINFKRKPSDQVYFIEAHGTGMVKIGVCTANPMKRLKTLQNGCPYELRIIANTGGGVARERALHKKFKAHHVRGEWFRNEGPILTLITHLQKNSA